jgi:hypothetical protein
VDPVRTRTITRLVNDLYAAIIEFETRVGQLASLDEGGLTLKGLQAQVEAIKAVQIKYGKNARIAAHT